MQLSFFLKNTVKKGVPIFLILYRQWLAGNSLKRYNREEEDDILINRRRSDVRLFGGGSALLFL